MGVSYSSVDTGFVGADMAAITGSFHPRTGSYDAANGFHGIHQRGGQQGDSQEAGRKKGEEFLLFRHIPVAIPGAVGIGNGPIRGCQLCFQPLHHSFGSFFSDH